MAYVPPAPSRVDQVGSSNTTFYELYSVSRRYRFTLQPDRNIVLYDNGRALWSSNTQKGDTSDGPYTLKLQADGNLCAYNWQDSCFWASQTQHRGTGPYCLTMQDDGNCVLYDSRGTATWSTGTHQAPGGGAWSAPPPPSFTPPHPQQQPGVMPPGWPANPPPTWQQPGAMPPGWPAPSPPTGPPGAMPPGWPAPSRPLHRIDLVANQNVNFYELKSEDGRFHLILQTDRNLVLYKHRDAIWASNTTVGDTRDGPYRLTLQTDGNFCAYNAQGQCFWASNTFKKGSGPYSLVLQNDGNCVLYDSRRQPTWSTDTWKFA